MVIYITVNNQVIKNLTNLDKVMLKTIYDYRCLTVGMIYKYFYQPNKITFENFISCRYTPLTRMGLITSVHSLTNQEAVFLTDLGISIVKATYRLPNEIYDYNQNKVVNLNFTASKLMMNQRIIDHQLALNDFAINASKFIHQKFPNLKHQFYGEKAISFPEIRPDGVIRFDDFDIFLEMDMGTESKRQLTEKWNSYRLFMSKWDKRGDDKKIIVLFICDCSNIEARKDLVRATAKNTFPDLISSKYDIYVGSKSEMMSALIKKIIPIQMNNYTLMKMFFNKILLERFGFKTSPSKKLLACINNVNYGFYIRKKDKDNKIIVMGNTCQEFLFDNYLYAPLSVLGKISLAERTSMMFSIKYHRDIRYLVLVNDLKTIYHHLSTVNLFDTPKVYYTTIDRLAKMSFPNALVQFDKNGDYYHCVDEMYERKEFEKNILNP